MPRRKHRGYTPPTPEEDTLTVSPVEVAYPSDILAENASTEESPAAPAEEEPPYDPPAEEAIAEAPTYEYPAEDYPIAEPTPEAEAPYAVEAETVEYLPIEEATAECEPEAEAPYAVEAEPVEYLPIEEATAEYEPEAEAPHADEAEPVEYPPVEEATAECEREAAQEPSVPSKSRAEDSDDGEVVIICTSCTTMLLIEYDGLYPYRITSSMGSDRESYSWLLHTTCFSCVNKHKHEWGSRDRFSNACKAAFAAAILSEEFMKGTSWFEVAGRVCRKPIRIVMDEARRSVAYGEIDILRTETTAKCRMRGLRSVELTGKRSGRTEIIDSFVPGGFM
jgi:hypothetical protein